RPCARAGYALRRPRARSPVVSRPLARPQYAGWCSRVGSLTRRALVARPFVLENFAKIAHVDPATARRTLNEVLLLVLPFAVAPLANDGLGRFHRRFCRSNVVRALLCSNSARPTACSGVAPAMNRSRHRFSRSTPAQMPLHSSSGATRLRRLLCL